MEMTLLGRKRNTNASSHEQHMQMLPETEEEFFPADLKAMTMTRARMAPCMNRWLVQP